MFSYLFPLASPYCYYFIDHWPQIYVSPQLLCNAYMLGIILDLLSLSCKISQMITSLKCARLGLYGFKGTILVRFFFFSTTLPQ